MGDSDDDFGFQDITLDSPHEADHHGDMELLPPQCPLGSEPENPEVAPMEANLGDFEHAEPLPDEDNRPLENWATAPVPIRTRGNSKTANGPVQYHSPVDVPKNRAADEWHFEDQVWDAIAEGNLAGSQWRWQDQGQLTLLPDGVLASSWSAREGRWHLTADSEVLLTFSGQDFQMHLRKGSRMLTSTRGGPAALVTSTISGNSQLELVFHPKQGSIHCQEWHKWLLDRQFSWGDEAIVVFRATGVLECPWESNALWLPAPDAMWDHEAGLPEYRVLRSGLMHRLVFSRDRRSFQASSRKDGKLTVINCKFLPVPETAGTQAAQALAQARNPLGSPCETVGYLMKRSGFVMLDWKPRWCVLAADGHTLDYFEPYQPWNGQLERVNSIPLATAEIIRKEYTGRRFCFHLNAPRSLQAVSRRMDHFFCSINAHEANAWFELIRKAIERANVAWQSHSAPQQDENSSRSLWDVFEDAISGRSTSSEQTDTDFHREGQQCGRQCSRKCLPKR
eukprot:TRINITY_DN22125_c0_g1_i1.p1 TRINITY_DN22125_c0_g1~~TRINITY_DN22125_c0_g1_i1.p1  ORF type:complete len:508 (+),score=56.32 TRINITY_DN22125_c0_g1_i1:184-1707(+)